MDRETIKQRVLEYLDRGDINGAIQSMMSDLTKDTKPDYPGYQANFLVCQLATQLILAGQMQHPEQVRQFINGI
ncbi:MAG TPA: hypothetical protein VK203_07830 [Nostocaceae cyanobacterium]|nr:hypothetical protein [Nostocaceae cyanobacterium]